MLQAEHACFAHGEKLKRHGLTILCCSLNVTQCHSNTPLFVSAEEVASHDSDNDAQYSIREHAFPAGTVLKIREFAFHPVNANLVWPGTPVFAEWLAQRPHLLRGRRVIELGSGTGILAIFLRKHLQCDITTCDYDDAEIEENITYNCGLNDVSPALPHIRHTWGAPFPCEPDWDIVIASDILLYVKQYLNLVKTLCVLLRHQPGNSNSSSQIQQGPSWDPNAKPVKVTDSLLSRPSFLMSWRRRINKADEALFFSGCLKAGLTITVVGPRTYLIQGTTTAQSQSM
eukprot:jgi/Chlat1/7149/Chrsp57S06745